MGTRIASSKAIASLLLGMAMTAGATCPGDYSYTVIADTEDQFASFERRPAIAHGEYVAFIAELDDGGRGIFAGNGNQPPIMVALDRDADPGSEFGLFGDPVIRGGGSGSAGSASQAPQVAFWAKEDLAQFPGRQGIYRGTVGSFPGPELIVPNREADPASNYYSLDPDIDLRDNGNVVFTAALDPGVSAVARGPGDHLFVRSDNDPDYFGYQRADATAIGSFYAYIALGSSISSNAIFRGQLQGGRVLVRADDDDAGIQIDLRGGPAVSTGGWVAYKYGYEVAPPPAPLATRLVRWGDQGETVIADSEVHDLRNLHLTEIAINGDGCVLFEAFQESVVPEGRRLFTGDDDGFQEVMVRFDPLLDGIISDFETGRRAINNGGQVAIWVELSLGLGQARELIVRANPNLIFSSGFLTAPP